jgi:hypothetical protein
MAHALHNCRLLLWSATVEQARLQVETLTFVEEEGEADSVERWPAEYTWAGELAVRQCIMLFPWILKHNNYMVFGMQ